LRQVFLSTDETMQDIPSSFLNLFRDARGRPSLPHTELWTRYDWCEDLAQQAVEPARTLSWQLGGGEAEVLSRVKAGLLASRMEDGSPCLSEQEAWWVEVRVAELLGWPHPDLPPPA
jgi:hypothetical protein